MDKRVREISHFFVAPPRMFPLSVCARAHESTHRFIHKYIHTYKHSLPLVLFLRPPYYLVCSWKNATACSKASSFALCTTSSASSPLIPKPWGAPG